MRKRDVILAPLFSHLLSGPASFARQLRAWQKACQLGVKRNPPKPGSIRIRRGSVRIFEDPWIRGSKKKKKKMPAQLVLYARCPGPAASTAACVDHGQRGALHMCREKFGPRPIFKIFSLDQIRVDQEKKEVRKRRASIHRSSPSDAVDYFLVSDVTGWLFWGIRVSN